MTFIDKIAAAMAIAWFLGIIVFVTYVEHNDDLEIAQCVIDNKDLSDPAGYCYAIKLVGGTNGQ